MNYKKLIPSQSLRFKLLNILDFIPDKWMIHLQYWIKTGRLLNLKNPKRLTEKLQWYKLYYRDSLMTQCVDKHQVRQYIIEKGYEDILIPQYGVYSTGEQIDFDKLPDTFVLKTTNASSTNIICENKNELDLDKTVRTLNDWMAERSGKLGREWAYYHVEPKIVCDKLLTNQHNQSGELDDYKFMCFDGQVQYVWVETEKFGERIRNTYDLNWNLLNVDYTDLRNCGDVMPEPERFADMIKIANDLSKDFPHVRVDLYQADGKIYFGELTFYSLSGYEMAYPDEFDLFSGHLFNLEKMVF